MHKRDVVMFLVCGLSILIGLRNEGLYQFHKQWIEPINGKFFQNGRFPDVTERIPPPLVTDVDGDGAKDLVIVTREPKIKILNVREPTVFFEGDSEVQVFPPKFEASLLTSVHISTGRQAVALASGYLSPFNTSPSKQVIVVVLEEWTVLCFDHRLKLLWETSLQDEIDETTQGKMFREISVVISSQPIHFNDNGAVIIGGRLVAVPRNSGEKDASEEDVMKLHEEYQSHFTYVALEGSTGKLKWKHSAADFVEHEETQHELNRPQINYKLSHHSGEKTWRQFRQSMLALLPHRWQNREHTSLLPVHVLPDAQSGPKKSSESSSVPKASLTFPSKTLSSLLQFNKFDFRTVEKGDHANAIAAKIHGGIELIHYFTGRTICQLPLETGSVHLDLNGDGVIDHVSVHLHVPEELFPSDKQITTLRIVASTGIPSHSELFSTSLATSNHDSTWFSASVHIVPEPDQSMLETVLSVMPLPAVMYRRAEDSGKHQIQLIHLKSTGVVTAVSAEGKVLWKSITTCGWSGEAAGDVPVHPSLEVVNLSEQSEEQHIICTGAKGMSLISEDGEILSQVTLDHVPVAAPILIDITDDGVVDVIVETNVAYPLICDVICCVIYFCCLKLFEVSLTLTFGKVISVISCD
eukprot:c7989_g1_i4.p1 GENE.c7989_g1_i4~~c7989_g1_i4.p1  ORF type:complete len:638 (+),score=178.76 c7989_g1_i4:38-1951(+)